MKRSTVPVTLERSPPVDLGRPASKLRSQRPGCPFELREIGLQPLVGRVAKILAPKLVQGRPQRAHSGNDTEHVFERL